MGVKCDGLNDSLGRIGTRYQTSTIVNANVPANTETIVSQLTDLPSTIFIITAQARIINTGKEEFGTQAVALGGSNRSIASADARYGYITMCCVAGGSGGTITHKLTMGSAVTVQSVNLTAYRLI